jgi:hypothetical protein
MADLSLLQALAAAFLAGEPSVEQIVVRASIMLGRSWRWLPPLAQRYVETYAGKTRPRQRDVTRFLRNDEGFKRTCSKYRHEIGIESWLTESQQMHPVAAAEAWVIPEIESVGALAKWFGVSSGELRWFADLKGLLYKHGEPLLRHYHYRILKKRSGGVRLIEAPKPRLKELQRQILVQILEAIPSHPAVHGFVKGRSIQTFVAPHVARRVVLRMDLQDFFPTFGAARIQSFFRTIGYPEAVADLLGGICTNSVPRDTWKDAPADVDPADLWSARRRYARPHLPQGAPCSPALANLCTYKVDCRLDGLAKALGAQYTRYADDLAFSSDDAIFGKRVEKFSTHVAAILMEAGFSVNFRKTRVMRQGVRQHLAGLVTNVRPNITRADFDRLKATLTNCVRSGPESQNREAHPAFRAHLEGRVGFLETINPDRGRRLRAIFDQIEWK